MTGRPPPTTCWAGLTVCTGRRNAACRTPEKTTPARLTSPLESQDDCSWTVDLSAGSGGRSFVNERRSVISPGKALGQAATPEPCRERGRKGETGGFLGAYRPGGERTTSDEQADGASEETPEARVEYSEEDASSGDGDLDECTLIKAAPPPPPPKARGAPRKPCLKKSTSLCSLAESESEIEAFEESERTLARAANTRRVRFDPSRDRSSPIPALEDYGWRTRRDCYWQPEEYAQMARSRVRLERAVLETGGRVAIAGESRRGLGLVCEPETRLARASKIQQTARLILRRHAEGATPGALARFAADASRWATRNALVCAEKDLVAAREALRDGADAEARLPDSPASPLAAPQPLEYIPRCDSNTASTDGLASMIRNDSLNDLANLSAPSSPAAVSYMTSATRHRIAPAAARVSSPA